MSIVDGFEAAILTPQSLALVCLARRLTVGGTSVRA
jgi:hypothetical protein